MFDTHLEIRYTLLSVSMKNIVLNNFCSFAQCVQYLKYYFRKSSVVTVYNNVLNNVCSVVRTWHILSNCRLCKIGLKCQLWNNYLYYHIQFLTTLDTGQSINV